MFHINMYGLINVLLFKFQLLLCPEKLNVKALAELYKQRSLESLGKSSKGRAKTSTSQSLPQTMLVKMLI